MGRDRPCPHSSLPADSDSAQHHLAVYLSSSGPAEAPLYAVTVPHEPVHLLCPHNVHEPLSALAPAIFPAEPPPPTRRGRPSSTWNCHCIPTPPSDFLRRSSSTRTVIVCSYDVHANRALLSFIPAKQPAQEQRTCPQCPIDGRVERRAAAPCHRSSTLLCCIASPCLPALQTIELGAVMTCAMVRAGPTSKSMTTIPPPAFPMNLSPRHRPTSMPNLFRRAPVAIAVDLSAFHDTHAARSGYAFAGEDQPSRCSARCSS